MQVRRVLHSVTVQGKDSKVKLIEQVINIVTRNKPNRTDRLEPKGNEVGQRDFLPLCVDGNTSGGKLGPNLSKVNLNNRETPLFAYKGKATARKPHEQRDWEETKSEWQSVMGCIGDEKIALW